MLENKKEKRLRRCTYVCFSQVRSKGFCNFADVNKFECLKAISELSRCLYENCTTHEESNAFEEDCEIQADRQSHLQDESFVTPLSFPTMSSGQTDRMRSSSINVTSAAEKSLNTAFMHGHPLADPDRNDESLDDRNTAMCSNSDAKVLGTKLFEEGKIARSFFISQMQEGLRKKEIPEKIGSLQSRKFLSSSGITLDCGPSNNALVKANQEHVLKVDLSSAENSHLLETETVLVREASAHSSDDNYIESESQQIRSDELQNKEPKSMQELPLKVGFRKDSRITTEETYFDSSDGDVRQRKARDEISKVKSMEHAQRLVPRQEEMHFSLQMTRKSYTLRRHRSYEMESVRKALR